VIHLGLRRLGVLTLKQPAEWRNVLLVQEAERNCTLERPCSAGAFVGSEFRDPFKDFGFHSGSRTGVRFVLVVNLLVIHISFSNDL